MTSPFALPEPAQQYCTVRGFTEHLAAPLSAEDQTVQTMADVSPTSWHRAHTTWFFETFVLAPGTDGYHWVDDRYRFLFNSYYEAVGRRQARAERGFITRPGIAEVAHYRGRSTAACSSSSRQGPNRTSRRSCSSASITSSSTRSCS